VEFIIIQYHIKELSPRKLILQCIELYAVIYEAFSIGVGSGLLILAWLVVELESLATIDNIVAYLKVDRHFMLEIDSHEALTHPRIGVFQSMNGYLLSVNVCQLRAILMINIPSTHVSVLS
jgi:hypothetical protein